MFGFFKESKKEKEVTKTSGEKIISTLEDIYKEVKAVNSFEELVSSSGKVEKLDIEKMKIISQLGYDIEKILEKTSLKKELLITILSEENVSNQLSDLLDECSVSELKVISKIVLDITNDILFKFEKEVNLFGVDAFDFFQRYIISIIVSLKESKRSNFPSISLF